MKQEVSHTQRVLNTWAVVIILWSMYRYFFGATLPIWFDEFIAKPSLFLLPIFYFITYIEKKSLVKGLDLHLKDIRTNLLVGVGFGLLFMAMGLFSYYLKYHSFMPKVLLSGPVALGLILTAFATSFSEELLSRGFVLKRLYEESKNAYTSVFFSSVLFFFLHIPYLMTASNIHGAALIQIMITDIIFSIIVSTLYVMRRSVWVAILLHAFYIISIQLFLQ